MMSGSRFNLRSHQQLQDALTRRCTEQQQYIEQLQAVLREHGVEIPTQRLTELMAVGEGNSLHVFHQIVDSSEQEINKVFSQHKPFIREQDITVEYSHLTFKVHVPRHREILSVSSILRSLLFFWRVCEEKDEVRILDDVTGRIKPRKMTLLIGPPGSGKSVLLQALCDRLRLQNGAELLGNVFYQGDNIHSGKFIPKKIAGYIEQGDTHDAVLSVEETLMFAWKATTGGHHSYGRAKDNAECVAELDKDNDRATIVKNVITGLALKGCKDVCVGNDMLRGISGGQKRRVTVGEMAVCPRPVFFMDCISNGLDTATTFDMIRAIRQINQNVGNTICISLLQPPPDVYGLFDEVILLSEGQVLFHGPRERVMPYFQSLGYECPSLIDEADFLQELPTPDGCRFLKDSQRTHDTKTLATAWRQSSECRSLLSEMKSAEYSAREHPLTFDMPATHHTSPSVEASAEEGVAMTATHPQTDTSVTSIAQTKQDHWFPDQKEPYPRGFLYYLLLQVSKQWKNIVRDQIFVKSRFGQSCIIGAISGSLFNNIGTMDVSTMNGLLFSTVLFGALGNFATFPIAYEQKKVFYKQRDSLYFPTSAYTVAQSLCLFPLTLAEQIIYITIVYWSAGLSDTENGSRFLTFLVVSMSLVLCIGQFFRCICSFVAEQSRALPMAGLMVVVMVLFSGYIQPKSLISYGWMWFYWMNPLSWALKAVTINEFSAPRYDFVICTNMACSTTERFGDYVLGEYGIPQDERYIWYSVAVLLAEYFLFFGLTFLGLEHMRTVAVPPPPVRYSHDDHRKAAKFTALSGKENATRPNADVEAGAPMTSGEHVVVDLEDTHLPFVQLSLAFKDVWYSVTLPSGDDVDLLKSVDGYFQPGEMTALMGASGAGKTTLLDVLAGRKNTGTLKGQVYVNGLPKHDAYFRKVMAYVEQFDTLPQKSTGRECIAFSAALRLTANITKEQRERWIDTVVNMLDLESIQNELVGSMDAGGMSFEQRKRVSIGVELVANPSILFLDEPTTGLDSRAAQALIRNIRRIASSGRTIVCTIHQPSAAIFSAFDALLLLKRGGQTVYFGDLGDHCSHLVQFFEQSPSVSRLQPNVNPATWMLEVIGAGTASTALANTDFNAFYLASDLCAANNNRLAMFTQPNEESHKMTEEIETSIRQDTDSKYNSSWWTQFQLLLTRVSLSYWRTPSYSLLRIFVNAIIALIFASAYPNQHYDDTVSTISRTAVIFVTTLFCGILSLLNIVPIAMADRAAFYREQQSSMYRTSAYALTTTLIEIPYVLLTSLAFTLPFFYIVGFDNIGNVTQKFFWYWLFNCLFQFTMINIGHFLAAAMPNETSAQVMGGVMNTVMVFFCGFLIAEQHFPTFWLFMYWLSPLHYSLEGLITAMFHEDTTPIQLTNGVVITAEKFVSDVEFTAWSYSHVGFDVLALGLFLLFMMIAKYLCLTYIRHDKR